MAAKTLFELAGQSDHPQHEFIPQGHWNMLQRFVFKIIIFDELKKPSMDKDLLESLRRSLGLVYFDENAT